MGSVVYRTVLVANMSVLVYRLQFTGTTFDCNKGTVNFDFTLLRMIVYSSTIFNNSLFHCIENITLSYIGRKIGSYFGTCLRQRIIYSDDATAMI